MTKKILSVLLILCLVTGLSGCGLGEGLFPNVFAERGVSPNANAARGEAPQDPEKIPEAAPSEDPAEAPEDPQSAPEDQPPVIPEEDPVDQLLSSLTLREKVGQLFIIAPESLSFDPATGKYAAGSQTQLTEAMKKAYEAYPCGGFCLFGPNIKTPDQLKKLNGDLHSLGSVAPLTCVDEEGGIVVHISNQKAFGVQKTPTMGSMAKAGDPSAAFSAYSYIGSYLAELGFDLDLAPIADVNTNPKNPIIGNRAFGSDPQLAALMVAQACDGLQSQGIMACLKHFPGHGDTSSDTHTGYAATGKTWEEIASCEMLPFKAGIEAGAAFVMAAHIAVPSVTGDKTPASLSPVMLTEKLRGELGFEGIIITDALGMGAVAKNYGSAEAALLALEAGADMLLMPEDYKKAFDGVMSAVESGRLSEDRIDESVRRILKAKMNRGSL